LTVDENFKVYTGCVVALMGDGFAKNRIFCGQHCCNKYYDEHPEEITDAVH
jgi:hypothetical protein